MNINEINQLRISRPSLFVKLFFPAIKPLSLMLKHQLNFSAKTLEAIISEDMF